MHPSAFQFGRLSITWYGIMVAVAFIVGTWTASRRAPRAGLHPETIVDLAAWLIIGGLAGGRLLYVITFWREQFAADPFPAVFAVWRGGLVFYGGLIGASLATIIFALIKKLPRWTLGDVLAPSLALGYVFGRIGCLLNGCCFGRECSLPWAIHFPASHQTGGVAVHPTQIYDAVLSFLLSLWLVRVFAHRRFHGQVFVSYLFGYGIMRFIVEFFRGDYPSELRYVNGLFTPAQLASILIVLTATCLIVFAKGRGKLEVSSPAGHVFGQPVAPTTDSNLETEENRETLQR